MKLRDRESRERAGLAGWLGDVCLYQTFEVCWSVGQLVSGTEPKPRSHKPGQPQKLEGGHAKSPRNSREAARAGVEWEWITPAP